METIGGEITRKERARKTNKQCKGKTQRSDYTDECLSNRISDEQHYTFKEFEFIHETSAKQMAQIQIKYILS